MMANADLIDNIRAAGLHPPQTMTLMVTDGCNLRCRHCWLDCRPHEAAVPVAAGHLLRVIDEFARLGGTSIQLTGGELLTHPDWLPILRFCLEHPSIAGVCLQTNATLIARGHIDALKALPPDKLTIQVSLDGAHAPVHDRIRGAGSFAKAMAGLCLLVQGGFGPRTRIAFTEMAHSFHELPRLLVLVDEMGLDRLVCNTLVKGGRAAASAHVDLPTCDQYRGLIRRYRSDPLFKKRCDQQATIAAIEWFKHRAETTDHRCGCIKNLFVDSRGRVYPCPMLLVEDFASASVHDRPLDRTIDQALARWRQIPILSRKRRQAIAPCAQCPYQPHCGGGCLGRAVVAGGGWMAPEDRCALRQAVYRQG